MKKISLAWLFCGAVLLSACSPSIKTEEDWAPAEPANMDADWVPAAREALAAQESLWPCLDGGACYGELCDRLDTPQTLALPEQRYIEYLEDGFADTLRYGGCPVGETIFWLGSIPKLAKTMDRMGLTQYDGKPAELADYWFGGSFTKIPFVAEEIGSAFDFVIYFNALEAIGRKPTRKVLSAAKRFCEAGDNPYASSTASNEPQRYFMEELSRVELEKRLSLVDDKILRQTLATLAASLTNRYGTEGFSGPESAAEFLRVAKTVGCGSELLSEDVKTAIKDELTAYLQLCAEQPHRFNLHNLLRLVRLAQTVG